ncbi:GAF domain-containing protein [Synechococcus elongatus]|uniref:GAF domain-containing protein n=1 Tax=Synechococcus elongatus PCC 11801 TaxID=2219813 RepID=A0AAN1QNG8_SYNEL|nr:GAF domain-containing protein [Synechococcus elongatus]AZB72552.1 GAF domain-containing protein [Synechococcus elongatus PCC 11801]
MTVPLNPADNPLVQFRQALAALHSTEAALALFLETAIDLTQSDAGSIFQLRWSLRGPELICTLSCNFSQPEIQLQGSPLPILRNSLAGYVATTGEVLNIPDVYQLPLGLPYHFQPRIDSATGYRTQSILVLPLKTPRQDVIGIVELINRKCDRKAKLTTGDYGAAVIPFSPADQQVVVQLLKTLESEFLGKV